MSRQESQFCFLDLLDKSEEKHETRWIQHCYFKRSRQFDAVKKSKNTPLNRHLGKKYKTQSIKKDSFSSSALYKLYNVHMCVYIICILYIIVKIVVHILFTKYIENKGGMRTCTKYNKHFSWGQLTQTLFSCSLNEQDMQLHSYGGRNASFSLYMYQMTLLIARIFTKLAQINNLTLAYNNSALLQRLKIYLIFSDISWIFRLNLLLQRSQWTEFY